MQEIGEGEEFTDFWLQSTPSCVCSPSIPPIHELATDLTNVII
jgi:hypothetical protein